METRLYPCRPQPIRTQPVRHPLQFKIVYTNIMLVLKSPSAYEIMKNNRKNGTILVCTILNGVYDFNGMILNGKGKLGL